MTFISRKIRITESRWLDECDAEYKLRACRKRSDGRLKRHISCDDFRAWVNNNCENYEYLVDLMSDGESAGKNSVQLYGRYIPVPILFKLMQDTNRDPQKSKEILGKDTNVQPSGSRGGKESTVIVNKSKLEPEAVTQSENNTDVEDLGDTAANEAGASADEGGVNGEEECLEEKDNELGDNEECAYEDNNEDEDDLSSCPDTDENKSEENVCVDTVPSDQGADGEECIYKIQYEKCLLEKKLNDCTSILCRALGKLEVIDEIVAKAELDNENFRNREIKMTFRRSKSECSCRANGFRQKTESVSAQNSCKAKESAKFNELLRKISELSHKLKTINEKINEQIQCQKVANCQRNAQVTELYSRKGDDKIKKLQKEIERLVSKKRKVVSELTQALYCLNKLKNSISSSKSYMSCQDNMSNMSCEEDTCQIPEAESCSCGCNSNENSSESCLSVCADPANIGDNSQECSSSPKKSVSDKSSQNQTKTTESKTTNKSQKKISMASNQNNNGDNTKEKKPNVEPKDTIKKSEPAPTQSKSNSSQKERRKEDSKKSKKSNLKYSCPEPKCKNKQNLYNIYACQLDPNSEVFANIANPRPQTSPDINRGCSCKKIGGGRKSKSETFIQGIENTLRHYKERFRCFESVDCKVEKLRQDLVTVNCLRLELLKETAELKKARKEEQEQCQEQISKLCSENWMLKKQIRQYAAKGVLQCQKIQNLKGSERKLKEELCEYKNEFQEQRKKMCMLESVVSVQRAEIEKLMNLIEKLRAMEDSNLTGKNCQTRSRSYSPEAAKKRGPCKKNHQVVTSWNTSSEDDNNWFCNQHLSQGRRSKTETSKTCCNPEGNREWS